MSVYDVFKEIVVEFLNTAHPAVIHFPIIGILMGFTAGFTALIIRIIGNWLKEKDKISLETHEMSIRYVDRFEFSSFIFTILGIGGYIIAAITGFYSAGGVEPAINNKLLEFKVRLSIYAMSLLLIPVFLKFYIGIIYRVNLFTSKSIIPGVLYLIPLMISAVLTMVVAGTGGMYVYGHSILEIFGFGWVFPDS